MKAAVFYQAKDLRITDIDKPNIVFPDDVLVKVHACGICGTDIHIYEGDEGAAPTPKGTVLGHEFAGEVTAIGENVTSVKVGDRVCIDPNRLCNTCEYCRGGIGHFCEHMIGIGTTVNGGFAEYCVVPESQVHKFSAELSYEQAAMTEPVACCLHGIDMSDISAGSTVAVIGGGMIGLIMLQLAKLQGASKLIMIEPLEEKRKLAQKLGASLAINPFEQDIMTVLNENGISRVDVVIECVGNPKTMEQAIEIAGKKATVMLFGLTKPQDKITLSPFDIFKKEISIKASFINPYTQKRALNLIDDKRIDVESMIYERICLDELPAVLGDKEKRGLGKYIVVF